MEGPRLKAGILGATGAVGQKFITLLQGHPWIEITSLAASQRSAGLKYRDAANWLQPGPIPEAVADLEVELADASFAGDCDFVFSALGGQTADVVEPAMAAKGYGVVSNARSFRQHPGVPLLVPELNPEHSGLIPRQDFGPGFIVTNPNCSTTGLVCAFKPLHEVFGIREAYVTTLQAISGAGYPGVSSLDILGNVVPFIPNEEDKIENEPRKILGTLGDDGIEWADFGVSVQVNRVPVVDGHLASVAIKLEGDPSPAEVREAWEGFESPLIPMGLPSAPAKLLEVFDGEREPQPRLHVSLGGGMTVSIGRVRPCPLGGIRFVSLVHNTVRGAAGGALLNAELLIHQGHLKTRRPTPVSA